MSNDKCTLSNEELIKKATQWIYMLAETKGNAWVLRIPADYNNDPDLLFNELCNRLSAQPSAIPQETVEQAAEKYLNEHNISKDAKIWMDYNLEEIDEDEMAEYFIQGLLTDFAIKWKSSQSSSAGVWVKELKEIKEAFQWTFDNMNTPHTSDHFNIPANGIEILNKIIESQPASSNDADYWKKRCEAAEKYISKSWYDKNTDEAIEALNEWHILNKQHS